MGTSASFALARKIAACLSAALLSFTLMPASALAWEEEPIADPSVEEAQESDSTRADKAVGASSEADDSASADSLAQSGALAASLIGKPASFVNADVALDGEPVIGSFTVNGLTFAVVDESTVELVGVSEAAGVSPRRVVAESQGLSAPLALPDLGSTLAASEAEADAPALLLPESVAYGDVEYSVASIGAYAFYLSGITSVELPASVIDVDDRAFRSSDVASVTVAEDNPTYSSFDGALYSADYSSLLLIPEGKQGAVLLPKGTEVAEAGKFSHCSLVDAISAEDGAAFASENGLLYTSDLTTLLRVPAGATEITIREGCTTIAAGAMEGCAQLATINAPASVTSISPDVFTSVPTVSLPVVSVADDGVEGEAGTTPRRVVASSQGLEAPLALPDLGSAPASPSTEASGSASTQLTALVALSFIDDDLPKTNPSSIEVQVPEIADMMVWMRVGLAVVEAPIMSLRARELNEAYALSYIETIGVSVSDGATSLWPAVDGVQTEPVQDVDTDFGQPGYNYLTSYQAGYFKCTSGIFHMYEHSRYGYLHVCPDVWDPNAPDNIMIAKDANTGRRLRIGAYSQRLPSGVTLGEGRTRPITFSGYLLPFSLAFDAAEGSWEDGNSGVKEISNIPYSVNNYVLSIPQPIAPHGYKFTGWHDANGSLVFAAGQSAATSDISQFDVDLSMGDAFDLYPSWERVEYDLGFDVDSEPGDEDYPGIEKPDETVNINDGLTVIEDPKRPGYVFQGWTIPNAEGTEAIDQDLVYQDESDGKWYVDASKLPDYANDDGRVELTARWTSVISVDVPSAVTFYADVVTEGQESREGAASSAFGQNKVASQSQVDLRIVGLESSAVETQGSTLGADSILKKAADATPSSSTQKLFSLYPTDTALTADDLQDPDAVSATKPDDAVDFALDDILLEKSFAADKFTIPAGDTLNLGYRLNLSETGTELDYDTLSTLDEGQSASIANISYCFAADYGPVFWTTDDDGSTLELAAIKSDAEAIAAGDAATISKYRTWMNADHRFYVRWYDQGTSEADNPTAATVYEVRIIGINHDDKSDGSGKAGITFQFVDCLNTPRCTNYPTCNTLDHMGQAQNSFSHKGQYEVYGIFDSVYSSTYSHNTNSGGWGKGLLRARMNPGTQVEGLNIGSAERDDDGLWNQVPGALAASMPSVQKSYLDASASVQRVSDRLFVLGCSELVSSNYRPGWSFLADEGETYEWYENHAIRGDADSNDILVKHQGDANGAPWHWWVRTTYPSDGQSFVQVNSGGAISPFGAASSYGFGVCPAFCL